MDIVSLQDPAQPALLAQLNIPKPSGTLLFNIVHEMYARHDTVYLSCGYDGLFIFELRDLGNQVFLGMINDYPDQDFNHSSWLDESGRHLMFTDEKQGMDVKVYRINNFSGPALVSSFNSHTGAMPHNVYWKGNLAIGSWY